MVWPDGGVCFAQSVADPPLGVAEPPFEVVELLVPADGLLVLYTDGLIESATVDTDTGMDRLAGLLRAHHGEDVDQLCDSLTRGLLPAGQPSTDDAALLVARVHATAPEAIATWSLPEDPQSAGAARRHVRDQLAVWDLEDLAGNTEMLASELVANVIRHARGPVRLRLLRSRTLTCEVFDGSVTTPRIRRASWTDEGGRGLQLIAALCDRWGTRYMTTGKCIWTEQSLPLFRLQPEFHDEFCRRIRPGLGSRSVVLCLRVRSRWMTREPTTSASCCSGTSRSPVRTPRPRASMPWTRTASSILPSRSSAFAGTASSSESAR
jgi:hypothetical protein